MRTSEAEAASRTSMRLPVLYAGKYCGKHGTLVYPDAGICLQPPAHIRTDTLQNAQITALAHTF